MKKFFYILSLLAVCATLVYTPSGVFAADTEETTTTATEEGGGVIQSLKERLGIGGDEATEDGEEGATLDMTTEADAEEAHENLVPDDTNASITDVAGQSEETKGWLAKSLDTLSGYLSVTSIVWWILVLVIGIVLLPLLEREEDAHPWWAAAILGVGLVATFSANPELWATELIYYAVAIALLMVFSGVGSHLELIWRSTRKYRQAINLFVEKEDLRDSDNGTLKKSLEGVPPRTREKFDRFWESHARDNGVPVDTPEWKGEFRNRSVRKGVFFPWTAIGLVYRYVFEELIEIILEKMRAHLMMQTVKSEQYHLKLTGQLPS